MDLVEKEHDEGQGLDRVSALVAFLHLYGTSLYSFIFMGLFVIVYHRQQFKQFVGCFARITVQKKDTISTYVTLIISFFLN
jgi:hypothetical protein